MKKATIITLIATVWLLSCSDKKQSSPANKNNNPKEVVAEKVTESLADSPKFESITMDIMKNLYDNCELIDYIFHTLPFSMNQNEINGIRSTISHVAQAVQESIPAGCQPIARQMFQIGGDIILEADVYFSDDCQFFVFYQKGKPVFANKMSNTGVQFYTNVITQAMNARKNIK